jgi:HD superfamily phosphohydrolase
MPDDRCGRLKSFKDPVHGYCDLCHRVAEVVDSWPIQRLRNIRQTAFAYLVYHGMEHSRFNHSIGVAHLAREVLSFVAGNTRLYYPSAAGDELANTLLGSLEVFQLAALMHDAGHLPFSHASEVGITEARQLFQVSGFEKLPLRHEAYTYSLIDIIAEFAEEQGISPVLTDSVASDLRALLQGFDSGARLASAWCASSVLNKLLVGGLDIDRMDYLIRDSVYAGVRYGVFDVDRLARVLVAVPLMIGPGNELERERSCSIAVLDKGISILESFLLARFYMFSEVYLHRVVEAYNSLYARLFALLARDGIITVLGGGGELEVPTPYDIEKQSPDAINAWKALDDNTMTMLVRRVATGEIRGASVEARELANRLVERRHPRLYKIVESRRLWASYQAFLSGAEIDKSLKSVFEEIADLQREKPLLMVRPLRVDLVSLSGIGIYDRARGDVAGFEEGLGDPGLDRLRKLAELGLYRIAVFATRDHTGLAERATRLLQEALRLIEETMRR